MVLLALLQQCQLGTKLDQQLRPTRAFTFSLLRVKAQDVALAPLAVANPYLLDVQVVGDLPVAARSCQHLILDIAHPAHRYGENVTMRRVRDIRSEEHTSELQSRGHLVCR